MEEIQKLILDKLQRFDEKLDKFDEKLDNITSEKIPSILVDVAKITERTSSQARFYTIIGGGIAILTSIGVSVAAMLLK